jgi:hypothetical protein
VRLRVIRLWNVRRFAGRGVAIEDIADGVNVLTAANEQGKSTCFDALHALFFQSHAGTPKAIQSLRPYSGGSPRIEADVETAAGLFRISKQFYSGKNAVVTDLATGRLVAQADEAEAWIGNLVQGGAGGPAGLLWVRQGVTELGSGTGREKDEERKAREDVLTSVAGEVEALTGGRRMVRVLARCEDELGQLVTATLRPRAGGRYAEALEETERLREQEQTLSEQVAALREALDNRRKRRARLAELTDEAATAERNDAKTRTTSEFEKARKHADKLSAAEIAEQLATARHQAAVSALQTLEALTERAAQLSKSLAEHEKLLSAAKADRDRAASAEASAAVTLKEAEVAVEAARAMLARSETARRAEEAAERLAELKDRLAKAEAARGRAEANDAEQKALVLPEKSVSELEKMEREIAALRATAAAEAMTLEVKYATGGAGRILKDGAPLVEGEPQVVASNVRLEIADIGTLSISPGVGGAGKETHDRLQNAEEERRLLLAGLQVADLADARAHQRLAMEKSTAAQAANAELKALAPEGIDALRVQVSRLEGVKNSTETDKLSAEEAEEKLKTAAASLKVVRASHETARADLDMAREKFIRAESTATSARDELARVESELGPVESRESIREARSTAVRDADAALKDATEKAEALRADAPDLEALEASANRAASTVERAREEAEALERDLAALDARISTRADEAVEENFEEVNGRRETAEARVARYKAEVVALARLKRALEAARGAAKEQYFGPVVEELKPLLSMLLDDATITFDEETLLPQSLARDGQDEDVAVLSGGMREQIAVLTRLAFARLLARDGRPVPVILDDALIFSDDDRIERMFDALHRQARDLQIIVLTCRQRAFERLGGQGLRMVDWRPKSN